MLHGKILTVQMSPRQLTTHTDGLTIQPQLKLELELSFTLFKICCIELGSVQKLFGGIFHKGVPLLPLRTAS